MLRQFQADISPATATLRQPQLSAPPSTAKTQIARYKTTVPILHTATKTNAAVITQPSSLFETDSPPPAESRGELDSWIMVGADGLGSKEDVRVFSLMGAVLDAAPG